jgi:hypothetical protein
VPLYINEYIPGVRNAARYQLQYKTPPVICCRGKKINVFLKERTESRDPFRGNSEVGCVLACLQKRLAAILQP